MVALKTPRTERAAALANMGSGRGAGILLAPSTAFRKSANVAGTSHGYRYSRASGSPGQRSEHYALDARFRGGNPIVGRGLNADAFAAMKTPHLSVQIDAYDLRQGGEAPPGPSKGNRCGLQRGKRAVPQHSLLAKAKVLASARHQAPSRPSFWLPRHFPAGIRGRETSFPASRLGKS